MRSSLDLSSHRLIGWNYQSSCLGFLYSSCGSSLELSSHRLIGWNCLSSWSVVASRPSVPIIFRRFHRSEVPQAGLHLQRKKRGLHKPHSSSSSFGVLGIWFFSGRFPMLSSRVGFHCFRFSLSLRTLNGSRRSLFYRLLLCLVGCRQPRLDDLDVSIAYCLL